MTHFTFLTFSSLFTCQRLCPKTSKDRTLWGDTSRLDNHYVIPAWSSQANISEVRNFLCEILFFTTVFCYILGPFLSNSLNIRHIWLAKFVLVLKILTGTFILTLGGWICLFANSTPIQQNPFWSGLILILSGLLGLYLLSFKRTRSKLKANFFWFLKVSLSSWLKSY